MVQSDNFLSEAIKKREPVKDDQCLGLRHGFSVDDQGWNGYFFFSTLR